MIKNKINRNMLLNVIRTMLSIAFPLITYPYATRVLGPEYFGKVNFGLSIIGYVSLVAMLGISNYAIREGGVYRKNKYEIDRFSSEVFTINLLSTAVSFILLYMSIAISAKLRNYAVILMIQSLSVLFVTIGKDWINVIFEDYKFITIRSLIVQLLSLIALFVFVKSESDYYQYACIAVAGNGIVSVINTFHVKRYCNIRLEKPNLRKHIFPILVLFSNNIAVTIYCNSDITMVGFFLGDYSVGLYSFASKIYTILKRIIAAAYAVSITRLTEYKTSNQDEQFRELLNDVINNIVLLTIPIMVGGIIYSNSIIKVLTGGGFMGAIFPFRILILAIMPAVIGGALAYCVNMPFRRETVNLKCTAASAVENIVLNLVLIPTMGISGAAISTFISEFTVCVLLLASLRNELYLFDVKRLLDNLIKCAIASMPIFAIYLIYKSFCSESGFLFFILVLISALLYLITNIIIKNQNLEIIIKSFL